jgi:hypothetical protein
MCFVIIINPISRTPSSLRKSKKRYTMLLYNRSRALYNIILRTGYFEIIPRNTSLSIYISEIFEPTIDDIDRDIFKIAIIIFPLETSRTIAEIELRGILIIRKRISNITINFSINKN